MSALHHFRQSALDAAREPAYGKAAERYGKERELGLMTASLLRQLETLRNIHGSNAGDSADALLRLDKRARELGLLGEEKKP